MYCVNRYTPDPVSPSAWQIFRGRFIHCPGAQFEWRDHLSKQTNLKDQNVNTSPRTVVAAGTPDLFAQPVPAADAAAPSPAQGATPPWYAAASTARTPSPSTARAAAAAAAIPFPYPAGAVLSGPFVGMERKAALVSLNRAFVRDVKTFVAAATPDTILDLSECMQEYLALAAAINTTEAELRSMSASS